VAHPAFAAARRAAARLLLAAGRAAIDRRATTANPPQVRAAAALWDGRTDRCIERRTVAWTLLRIQCHFCKDHLNVSNTRIHRQTDHAATAAKSRI